MISRLAMSLSRKNIYIALEMRAIRQYLAALDILFL